MKNPALFLDRDGTIIEDVGVLGDPAGIRLFEDTVDALTRLQRRYQLFVVTNQNGIAKGLVSRPQVDAVNAALEAMLRRSGVAVRRWYVCPHDRRDECRCIKPNPTFLLEAAREFDLDLAKSFVIGDHPHDAATGEAAGAFGLYVLTGHGMRHLGELPDRHPVFHTLGEAGKWILSHPGGAADVQRSIEAGAEALRRGGLTVFPTETVYGLGADALNAKAVARIFEVKARPLSDPLIVHTAGIEQAKQLVRGLPGTALRLMESFWPGPLTLVLPKSDSIPDIVTAGQPTVAVRMPSNPLAQAFIRRAQTPVAAPSANLFGRTSPTTAGHVRDQLQGRYEALIDGGACRVGIESTVLSLAGPEPTILRHGGTAKEHIEAVIGAVRDGVRHTSGGYESPGMLEKHYAPMTPLIITEDIETYVGRPDVGKLFFMDAPGKIEGPYEVLSRKGDVCEAAVALYYAMRRLDSCKVRCIAAQRAPDEGLGKAINDRLGKAAAGSGAM